MDSTCTLIQTELSLFNYYEIENGDILILNVFMWLVLGANCEAIENLLQEGKNLI